METIQKNICPDAASTKLTENQIKAIKDFAFANDSMTVLHELNEMYRSWIMDPVRRELYIEEALAEENRDRAFLIEELVTLVHDLYKK